MNLKDIRKKLGTTKDLYTKIAEINKLTGSTIEDNSIRLPTVELISGKKVQLTKDPVEIVQDRLNIEESSKPVVDQLNKIANQQDDLIDYQKELLANINSPELPAIEPSQQPYQTDSVKQMILNDYDLKQPNQLTRDTIGEELNKVQTIINKIGGYKGAITRKGDRKTEQDIQDYKNYNIQSNVLLNHKDSLKRLQQLIDVQKGGAITPNHKLLIGDYWVDKNKLRNSNILSVRYNSNNAMVPQFGVRKVSDNVKTFMENVEYDKNVPPNLTLSPTEKQFLNKLFLDGELPLSKPQANLIRGGKIFTSIQDMSDRIQLLIGQIEAGNTSNVIKNELLDLLHFLYTNGKIRKRSYEKIVGFLASKN